MPEPAANGAPVKVLNPATEEVIGEVREASREDLDTALSRSRKAQQEWWAVDEDDRRSHLGDCAKALKAKTMRLARLLTEEQGKPLRESVEELMGAVHWIRTVAAFRLPVAEARSTAGDHVLLERRPVGTVAAITPWNYPLILAAWKIAPALVAGNSVLLKPSPYTPLATTELVALLADHLPAGLLQVVTGGDQTGRALAAHDGVDHISLTGSIAAGRSVGAQAGRDLKSCTLELGGNDAAIVLDDADPARAAEGIFQCAFRNCGQTCTAIKRVYVHRSLHDQLVEALHAHAVAAVVGNGLERTTTIGPLNNKPQLLRVQTLLADAVATGGTVLAGGQALGPAGYFLEPAIVANLGDEAALVTDEQFGPVLPVLPFDQPEEAVRRANQSGYGLGGSVWSTDSERAARVASRLEAGTTWINRHGLSDPAIPFGGTKDSGLGYANGLVGLEEFTRLRAAYRSAPE